MHDLGDVVPLSVSVYDSAGTLADATAVTCVVTLPDASTASVSVTKPSTGVYTGTYTPAMAGRFIVNWVATGTNASAFIDSFDVSSSAPVVSLADVRSHLNITATTHDEELRATARAATAAAEAYMGQSLARTSVSETFDGGSTSVLLTRTPVLSVTTVTESGSAVASTSYHLDGDAGILTRLWAAYTPGQWMSGLGNIAVTYVAGRTTIPDDIRHAVLELTRHLWETQRGGMVTTVGQPADEWNPAQSFSIPRRVAELLDPHRTPGAA